LQVDLTADHFTLFGLERGFALEPADLTARYRELQQLLHPDRFAAASEAERRWSVQAAGRVNDAYTTLKAPLRRAVYLLSLSGVDIDEESDTRMDPEFLMEQMELREGLEAAGEADDPRAALAPLNERLRTMAETAQGRFGEALAAKDLDAARTEARQWQFVDKLRREAASLEARLDA